MLIYAFAGDVIQRIEVDPVRTQLDQTIEARLAAVNALPGRIG
ncbi:MAG: hypothetical protein M5R36_09925 [Deltaproteobacteria bacterium]|nr:hypothetical protein [Deltaproteobacteria bacterium]